MMTNLFFVSDIQVLEVYRR